MFLLFSLPTFLLVRERPRRERPGSPPAIRQAMARLLESWRRTRDHRGVTRFLVGRFFYTDAINTLIGGFLTIFVVEELDFSDGEVQGLLAVAIAAAMVGGFVAGRLVDRHGPRRILHAALHAWMFSMAAGIVAAAADLAGLVWLLGVVGGAALGATWASDRVYMSRISPPRYFGEFYGLYATVGRFATIVGPLMWGLIVTVAGLPREVAMGVLIVFLVTGRYLLGGVDDEHRRWSREELLVP